MNLLWGLRWIVCLTGIVTATMGTLCARWAPPELNLWIFAEAYTFLVAGAAIPQLVAALSQNPIVRYLGAQFYTGARLLFFVYQIVLAIASLQAENMKLSCNNLTPWCQVAFFLGILDLFIIVCFVLDLLQFILQPRRLLNRFAGTIVHRRLNDA